MAYSISSQSGTTIYEVIEYVVNTEADVATVPTTAASGSTIFVIATSNVYMLTVEQNGVKQWSLI